MARHQRKVLLLISDGNDTQTNAAGVLPPPPSEIGDLTAHFGDSQRTQRGILIGTSRNAVRRSDAVLYAIGIGTRSGVPVDINLLDGLTKESGVTQSRCVAHRRSRRRSRAFATTCSHNTS